MDNLLKGQAAIVTGATAGIGKAIALAFAKQGAKVALFGTNEERAESALREIREAVGDAEALFIKVDVRQKGDMESAIKSVLQSFGQVDILVNNAGITRDQLLMKMSESDWDDVMETNVKSCYNSTHALVRSMMKARRGKIINVSSVVGLKGNAGQANYAASKAAIIGFSKALAQELAARNICVNCIAPGFIQTRMTDVLTNEQKEEILSRIPLRRLGTVDDIANMALYLASPLSDYITGQVFSVDGGMAM